jgi:hypothetical protein
MLILCVGFPDFIFSLSMGENMAKKTVAEQTVCPFTLDPFKDCTIRKASCKEICPFTLEPCFL